MANMEKLTYKGETRRVANSNDRPFEAVAYLTFFTDRQFISSGTGFLVQHQNRKFVATAAHSLRGVDRVQIKFGLDYKYEPCDSFSKTRETFMWSKDYSDKEPDPYDYGIIVLNDGDSRFLPQVSFSLTVRLDPNNKKLIMKGYPKRIFNADDGTWPPVEGVQYETHVDLELSCYGSQILCYEDTTSAGNSGSPIYEEENGEYKVVGIHSIGKEKDGENKNYGVRITDAVRSDMMRMYDQLTMSRAGDKRCSTGDSRISSSSKHAKGKESLKKKKKVNKKHMQVKMILKTPNKV